MLSKLFDLIKQNWLNYTSIPVAWIVLIICYFPAQKTIREVKDPFLFELASTALIVIFIIAFVLYPVLCFYKKNHLPSASSKARAVLFVIDAENSSLYEAVKFKLVHNFEDLISTDGFDPFEVICLPRTKTKNYNLKDKRQATELLSETNCSFLVIVKYVVDDTSNAERFQMCIDYGVRHPRFNYLAEQIFSTDMQALSGPISKQRFIKAQTLDVFDCTAQTLVFICQYMLGFMYLLSGSNNNAFVLLSRLQTQLLHERQSIPIINLLTRLTKDRLFATYIQIVCNEISDFEKDKEYSHLITARNLLAAANRIYPDTYSYNLNMAYVYIVYNQNATKARECIGKCKKAKQNKDWKYSDAFLSAYMNHSPRTICSKYKEAFTVSYNLVRIVDYIEYVLTKEPTKYALHLAAGLVYEELGNSVQMKIHFSKYLSSANEYDDNIAALLDGKMKALPCDIKCDHNCQDCAQPLSA